MVNEKVFVAHGGIGPEVLRLGMSEINAEANRFADSFAAGTAMDELLWSGRNCGCAYDFMLNFCVFVYLYVYMY